MFYTKSLALVTLTKASICVLLNIRFEVTMQPAPWSQMLQSIMRHEAKCYGMFGVMKPVLRIHEGGIPAKMKLAALLPVNTE